MCRKNFKWDVWGGGGKASIWGATPPPLSQYSYVPALILRFFNCDMDLSGQMQINAIHSLIRRRYRQRSHGRQLRREGGKLRDDQVRARHVRAVAGRLRRWVGRRISHGHLLAAVRVQLSHVSSGSRQSRHVQRIARLRDSHFHLRAVKSLASMRW